MLVFKHHISKDFEENPSLVMNNGAGAGATVFTDYNKMLAYLKTDGRSWHVAPLEVEKGELHFNFGNDYMATILCDKSSKENFKPVLWEEEH